MASNTTQRSDGDTWDLASSVGATATAVAAGRAIASQGPEPLLTDTLAEPLVRAVGLESFVRLIDDELPPTDDPVTDRQRMREQITVRTRFFDDFFTRSTAAGIRQAVILASGLDTRAYRLDWPAGTVVFEVDQPEVIAFKTQTLAALGAGPAADRRTVGIDLRDDWPAALRAAGFDPGKPTAWIAEGLLIYLPPEAQDRLFDNITALSAPGSRLATEEMDLSALPDDWAERLAERSRRFGTGINLAELFYHGERASAATYLGGHGWQTTVLKGADAFAANGFEQPDDEWRTLGADSGYLSATLGG
ncbi:S-adenosyl-L-methionine-dependent methyl transferase [Mycolicibacterium canariasense]|uniref:S-adenosyl-L-methionine-dependent methyltransferase n=1 Tax=Mycolicibacterium canariasense TaxID=228230 RepID=A0A100WFG9_MYCCR|nr:class I SAM-dependent methyltransferase [Mycolicibacterium canariasense]MCV7211332.1 class I SAM-dependent methyltransferase [Mycolicibacterium canariasense]ORV03784.1 SAM-dependent methyltransferase [Mycolicibacterium canariasense]GAS97317.1 S-adenosyl-L-methionine-dependent methyl transferase [Mycolicibacterium canariasense]